MVRDGKVKRDKITIQKGQRANMFSNRAFYIKRMLLSAVIPSSVLLVAAAPAQSRRATVSPVVARSGSTWVPHRPVELPPHAQEFYMATLGVDSLALKAVESGVMIRFSYRVVNAEKADVLNDKKTSPYLLDERTHRALVIPTIEQVGQLRQSGTTEVGKVYWMLFSNKGNFVKPGSRVSVVFGKSHIDGLVVQ